MTRRKEQRAKLYTDKLRSLGWTVTRVHDDVDEGKPYIIVIAKKGHHQLEIQDLWSVDNDGYFHYVGVDNREVSSGYDGERTRAENILRAIEEADEG